MARGPNEKVKCAEELYHKGTAMAEIAKRLGVSDSTVRSWKSRYQWDGEKNATLRKEKRNVAKVKKCRKRRDKEPAAEEVRDVMQNTELTDKQRLFCVYYIRCFNATKAYQKAYEVDYSTAASIGYRMLENDGVKTEIQRLKKVRFNRAFFSEEDVFQKYMDIAFADVTEFLSFGQREVPVMGPFGPVKIKDEDTGETVELTKVVNTVSFRESSEVDGTLISEVKQGKDGASIKLADRMKALQWLTDHMDMATEEQRARIAALKAKADAGGEEGTADDGFIDALNNSAGGDWSDEEG